jgi:hypothetical protein
LVRSQLDIAGESPLALAPSVQVCRSTFRFLGRLSFVASSSSARELTPGYDWDGVYLIVVHSTDTFDLGFIDGSLVAPRAVPPSDDVLGPT